VPNHLAHFAVHANDLARAQAFYGKVFGWQFEPWGPPGFFIIKTGEPEKGKAIQGALHQRIEPVTGKEMIGFECSIAVDDIDATLAAVQKNGGTIIMPKATIPTVGTLIKFLDPEGNFVCAIQYEPSREQ
jgi:predicted enzyme related to lactoylglutathione lyase